MPESQPGTPTATWHRGRAWPASRITFHMAACLCLCAREKFSQTFANMHTHTHTYSCSTWGPGVFCAAWSLWRHAHLRAKQTQSLLVKRSARWPSGQQSDPTSDLTWFPDVSLALPVLQGSYILSMVMEEQKSISLSSKCIKDAVAHWDLNIRLVQQSDSSISSFKLWGT